MTIPAAASTAPAPRTAGESTPSEICMVHLRFVLPRKELGERRRKLSGKSFTLPSPNLPARSPAFPLQNRSSLRIPVPGLSRVLEAAERLFLPTCAIPAGRVNRRACRQAFTPPTAAPFRLSFFTSSPGRRTRPTGRLQARHSWAYHRDQASHRRYSARRSPTSPQKARHR